jgi:hypothetical protein
MMGKSVHCRISKDLKEMIDTFRINLEADNNHVAFTKASEELAKRIRRELSL